MKRVIGAEVRSADLVLRVRVLRDEGYDILKMPWIDDRDLSLHIHTRQIRTEIARRAVNRSCGLTTVHNLHSLKCVDATGSVVEIPSDDFLRYDGDTIVIGHEIFRTLTECLKNSLVYLSASLKI